jgi:ABC-2 type transport system ATP-binding protein
LSDAETLCDRVGVIAGGKLLGVGAPGSIVGVRATGMEIVFELAESAPNAQQILAKATKSGMNFRISVIEGELYAALGELRAAGAKIISVTQIKPTLEDYFLELVGKDRAQAAAIEVSGK